MIDVLQFSHEVTCIYIGASENTSALAVRPDYRSFICLYLLYSFHQVEIFMVSQQHSGVIQKTAFECAA